MSTHYTAIVDVTETITQDEVKDRYEKVVTPASRTVSEVTKIVVRADTLGALVNKVHAHVALVASASGEAS